MISRFTFQKGPRVFEVLVAKKWTPSKLQEIKIQTKGAFPIFLEEDDFEKGSDVFAFDFLLMRNQYTLLEGKDIITGLDTNRANLRTALEAEVRRLLASARQAYFRRIPLNKKDITVTLQGLLYGFNYLGIKKIEDQDLKNLSEQFFARKKAEALLEILEKIEKIIDEE